MNIIIIYILFLLSTLYNLLHINNTSKRRPPLPPGPTPLPYIGSLITMYRNKPTFRWIHGMMDEMNTKIVCVRLGKVPLIAVSDPKMAVVFLKDTEGIYSSRPESMSAHLISDGYLNTVHSPMGDHWKKMKKILLRDVLSPATHKWLLNKRNEEEEFSLRYINNQNETNVGATKGLVNVRIMVIHHLCNMARTLMFGSRYLGKGSQDGGPGVEEIDHLASMLKILSYHQAFCVTDYIPSLRWITDFDGHEKSIRKAILETRKYQDPLIDKRIKKWKDGVRTEQDDLLDIFINLKNPSLTPDEIKAQILDLILASFDNVSNNIEWAMADMLDKPMIFERVVEELDTVVGNDRLVQESDLRNLNYVKACVKEAFRLHPAVPFSLPHMTTEESIVGGYFIPKDSHVIVSRRGLGRNPDVWEDPLTFNPDRHLNGDKEVVLSDNNLHTFSFGIGRRRCPGELLGSTNTTMLLARLVQAFSWELPPDQPQVNLDENLHNLSMAKPLIALAKPRIPSCLYTH